MVNETKYTKIDFKAKIKPIKPLNPEFDLVKIYVQGAGCNRNMTYMSKDNVEKYASETLSYCPVVGHIIHGVNNETGEEMNWIGGHDIEIDWENWTIKDLTVPYGCVCEQEFEWETINEYGKDVEYLTAYAILWTGRYEDLKTCIYSDEIWFNQSMEINVSQYRPYEDDSNYTELLEWTYSALCLLGKADGDSTTGHIDIEQHTEPCFINSCVKPVEFSKSEFTELMNEMKEKISFALKNQHSEDGVQATEEFDIKNNNNGGNQVNKKDEIAKKFGKVISELDFSVDDMTDEEFENKMEELFGEKEVTKTLSFSATYNQKRDALRESLRSLNSVVKDDDDNYVEEIWYYLADFDDNYVFVEVDHWTVDNYECKYGRIPYVFDAEKLEATVSGDFEEMIMEWLTLDEKAKLDAERSESEAKYSNLEKEFSDYKAEHSFLDSDVDELKAYKSNKEAEERKCAEDAVFAKYSEVIGDTDEFSALKENVENYTIEALEKECVYIVGKYAISNKTNDVKTKAEKDKAETVKFSLGTETVEDEPYGGLMRKYNKKKMEEK